MIWGVLTIGLALALDVVGLLLFVIGQCDDDIRRMERDKTTTTRRANETHSEGVRGGSLED